MNITGPLFKWFGCKWSSAKYYPRPSGDTIFEPYAGAAGYSLRHWKKDVVIWEENKDLQKLWTWLISEATWAAIVEIPVNIPEKTDIRTLGLSEGQALLLKNWQRTNNYSDCWTISSWGNKPGQWTANTRARVADEYACIHHWKLRKIGFWEPGFYFIDPPYQYNYRYGYTEFDYRGLVNKMKRIPSGSEVVACEAICPKSGIVPNYLPFKFFRHVITSRRGYATPNYSKELMAHYKVA